MRGGRQGAAGRPRAGAGAGAGAAPARTALVGASLASAGATFLLAEQAAARSWTAPRYSRVGRYVSDLGVPQRTRFAGRDIFSPRHAVMNAGFVSQGLLVTAGAMAMPRARSRPALRALAGVYGLAMVGVGVFHGADASSPARHTLHGACASLAVAAAALAALVTGRSPHLGPAGGVSRRASSTAGLVALVAGLAVPVAHGSSVVGLVQRASLYAVTGWQLLTGTCLVHHALRTALTRGPAVLVGEPGRTVGAPGEPPRPALASSHGRHDDHQGGQRPLPDRRHGPGVPGRRQLGEHADVARPAGR